MSIPDFPGEALVRSAEAPLQPSGTRWYTDCGNAAGTAHLYTSERNGLLIAHCGREILESDRQSEKAALVYCKRCLKRAEHPSGMDVERGLPVG